MRKNIYFYERSTQNQMDMQFEQYKRLSAFLTYFFPGQDITGKELNAKNCDSLIYLLISAFDALIKGENLFKKRNMMLQEGHSFFSRDPIDLIGNIILYLYKFETKIFSFSRTERQTYIFILENLIDYYKRSRLFGEKKEQKDIFIEYRFWIENLFKMSDQKITGTIYSSTKLNLKNIFTSDDFLNSELIYSNTAVSFSISPFVIFRDEKHCFLTRIDKSNGRLIYTSMETNEEFIMDNIKSDLKIFEFLLSNFDFYHANLMKPNLDGQKHILLDHIPIIENAYTYFKEGLFMESHNLLKDISFENLDIPLLYLLQIRNMININHLYEAKKLIQKFIMLYPHFSEGFEVMGDIHAKEEEWDAAIGFYEKALKITQHKRVSDKLKRLRESTDRTKQQAIKEKNENFFDISETVYSNDEKLLMRDKEFRQMIEVLLSDSKRNIMLVGDSGVGKTSLIRLLQMKMLNGEVPDSLRDKHLKEINFVSLLTGAKYRGQFEEKVVKLLTDFQTQKAILVIEDVHLTITTGVPRGTSMDLVTILKPFLREKTIQVIATTTYEEFKNTVEKDNSLMGFFQKITVNEMSQADTRKILKNLAQNVFSKEKIIISDEIIDHVMEVAKRDVRDKRLPDSVIMLMERAIAKVKYKIHVADSGRPEVEMEDVSEVVSDMLNLPDSNRSLSLKSRLMRLKDTILSEIVGQDEAIERMVAGITTAKLKFDIKKGRPDGVFLFIGPTGVGKTETALALCRALYGSEDHLIRIDMSEYMEKFTYSRFVGSAPGYVGYNDTNQLTDKVRQNPYSIILLDEVEKADSQLMNIFLQVFDAGRLTDARGNVVDFSHTTIIMTSNIGTSLFSKTQMGYQGDLKGGDVSHTSLMKSLKKYFSPEFLNRIDDVMIFNHLKEEQIKQIIEIQLRLTRELLEKQDKELIIHDEVIDYIISEGYSKEYGARHLGRVIRKALLEKIAQLSLEKDWDYVRQVICTMDKTRNEIEVFLESEHLAPIENPGFIGNMEFERG